MASAAPPAPGFATSRTRAVAAVGALLLLFGLVRAVQLAWVCDDAFISLRYAANLVEGHGLVYNPGEYVEGYTNLLWTLSLAAALALGLPDVASAEALGIAAWVALLLALAGASAQRHRREGAPFLPLAAACVAVSPDFQQWATGGLETSLFSALALGGLLLSRRAARGAGPALAAGVLLALATLTRPDGLLFVAGAAAGLVWDRRPTAALRLLLPVAITVAGWAAFKLPYYGELLPTPFYSKSVLHPYYAQGLVYLGLYLGKNWFLPLALGAWLVWRLRVRPPFDAADRDALVLAGTALVYLAYVVHVGGDFMFARRILPAVPPLLLALEGQLLRVGAPRTRLAAAALCVAAAALPTRCTATRRASAAWRTSGASTPIGPSRCAVSRAKWWARRCAIRPRG
jgi:arabinofuranosyltransferase